MVDVHATEWAQGSSLRLQPNPPTPTWKHASSMAAATLSTPSAWPSGA